MFPIMRQIITGTGIVKRGLVAWYDFTEPAGSQVLYDRSGHGNNAVNGSTIGADTNDITFDGIKGVCGGDDYFANPITEPPNSEYTIFFIGDNAGIGAGSTEKLFTLWGNGCTARFADSGVIWFYNTAAAGYKQGTIGNVADGRVRCYAISNGANGQEFYTNDAKTGGWPIKTTCTASQKYYFLTAWNAGAEWYTGNVYSIAVYYRALSSGEIKQNYKAFKRIMAGRGISL